MPEAGIHLRTTLCDERELVVVNNRCWQQRERERGGREREDRIMMRVMRYKLSRLCRSRIINILISALGLGCFSLYLTYQSNSMMLLKSTDGEMSDRMLMGRTPKLSKLREGPVGRDSGRPREEGVRLEDGVVKKRKSRQKDDIAIEDSPIYKHLAQVRFCKLSEFSKSFVKKICLYLYHNAAFTCSLTIYLFTFLLCISVANIYVIFDDIKITTFLYKNPVILSECSVLLLYYICGHHCTHALCQATCTFTGDTNKLNLKITNNGKK